ncbi:hypothetical protein [Leisingera caerulea]|uniref:hypothetical protein n=1 Tax=Leisingera caerulea TaxID=506591 RepID=UPI0021A976B5|nr:hypothetical protein [Leisingera caerulea]UWQ85351.1 hypothetical protein K3726_09140 [Leisingera caerulea]
MRTYILGNQFENALVATSTIRESLYGRDGDDTFSIYHYDNGTYVYPDLSDRFFGGAGDDTISSLNFDLTADSTLRDYSQLSFHGGAGYDTVSSQIDVQITGGFTLDLSQIATSVRSVEHWDYGIDLGTSTGDGDFVIRSGRQDDTLDIRQREAAEDARVTVKTLAGNDHVEYSTVKNVSDLRVNTGAGNDYFEFNGFWNVTAGVRVSTGKGNDTVVINGTTIAYPDGLTANIRTGGGADTIVLEGMHSERLKSGGGDDDIYVLTGSFSNAADTISTGAGKDELFIELDAYSTVAVLDDFSAQDDVFVFDADEAGGIITRNTDVTFDRSEWENASEDRLYMSNAENKLYYGDNVLVDFTTDVTLSAANFTTGDWEY